MKKSIVRAIYKAMGDFCSKVSSANYSKIVFIANYGRGYLCNPKYVAEALNRLFPGKYDIVFLVKEESSEVPGFVRQVKYRGIKALKELATARVWVDNCRGPKYVPKRPDQFYIQLWHAYLGPKKIERDAADKMSEEYVSNAIYEGSITDLMFANNDLYERVFHESFWYDGPVLRCGAPRNRLLIRSENSVSAQVKERLGISQDAKICLYAPTFRKDFSFDSYAFDFQHCLNALSKKFGGRFVLVYRLHPNLAHLERPSSFSGCVDATDYFDSQELVASADVMVSDYSSILEDFALTRRPGFVLASDIGDYLDDRGFYYPLTERPFAVCESEEELIKAIEGFDEREHLNRVDSFLNRFGVEDDGAGDEYVARAIASLMRSDARVEDVC